MHKLLLADDSVTIQRVIELTFSGEDIQVVAVNDGEQAIARIPGEQPDIVLADIGMPKKGGYDVAAFVKGRADLEHIPVLLLAGAFEPVDQARAEQVRCDGVLVKPFEPRQVVERVRELLKGMKGSPAQATAGVLRPVERLSPRPESSAVPAVPPVAAVPPAAVLPLAAASADEPVAAFEGGSELDDYFESLNTAFDSVDHAATSSRGAAAEPAFDIAPPPPPPPPRVVEEPEAGPNGSAGIVHAGRRRGDHLEDYFDRLSTAFEQAKPSGAAAPPRDGFDELLEQSRVPTVDALVGEHAAAGVNGGRHAAPARANGHADAPPRNPIVEALEAMLAAPDAPNLAPAQPALPGLPDALARSNGGAPPSELAETITRRVLERLVPEITATVQRLVQDEIERMRQHH